MDLVWPVKPSSDRTMVPFGERKWTPETSAMQERKVGVEGVSHELRTGILWSLQCVVQELWDPRSLGIHYHILSPDELWQPFGKLPA